MEVPINLEEPGSFIFVLQKTQACMTEFLYVRFNPSGGGGWTNKEILFALV